MIAALLKRSEAGFGGNPPGRSSAGVLVAGEAVSASMTPIYEDFPWRTPPWLFLASFLIGLGSLVICLVGQALD